MQLHSPHLMSSACRFPNAESWSEFERATKRETRKIFVSLASLFSVVDVVMVVVKNSGGWGKGRAWYQQRPTHWQLATEAGNFLGSINSSTRKTSLVGVECISTNIYEVFLSASGLDCVRVAGKGRNDFRSFPLSEKILSGENSPFSQFYKSEQSAGFGDSLYAIWMPMRNRACRSEKFRLLYYFWEFFPFIFILGKQRLILSLHILCATLLNLLFIRP